MFCEKQLLELFHRLMLFLNEVSPRTLRLPNVSLRVSISLLWFLQLPQLPLGLDYIFFSDRKPGDIHVLTDYLLEDYKNFPKVPEFWEETACFIRKEMEDTWGSEHLSVLPEAEAQHWILGVGFFTHFISPLGVSSSL